MLLLDAEAVHQQEEALRLKVRQLSEAQRQRFYHRFNRQVKDPDTYAVLNYLLVAGLHHFYLGRVGRGCLNMGLFVMAVTMLFSGWWWLGLAMIGVLLVAELPALLRSELIVADYNNRLMERLLREVREEG